jgi:hypothetical protein
MKRAFILLFSLTFILGCNNPGRRHTEEKRAVQEELDQLSEQDKHRDPDGAFGAKDVASEARELSERDTKALEETAKEIDGD